MSLLSLVALAITLVVVSFTDLRRRIVPNRMLLIAVGFWLVLAAWSGPQAVATGLVAAIVIAMPLLVAALARPDGMGMGDVKLVAVIGLFLGWQAWPALLAGLALAGFSGVLVALGSRRPLSETSLPLAPFLALGTALSLILLQ